MRQSRNSILIPTELAHELVAPHKLDDVLKVLQANGYIANWCVLRDHVAVDPAPGKRVDLALLHLDDTTARRSAPTSRKRAP